MKKGLIIYLMVSVLFISCKKESRFSQPENTQNIQNPELPLKIVMETKVIRGFNEPDTPDEYDRVGYNRYYLKGQVNKKMPVLIIVSGYVADTAWFNRMARDLVIRKNVEVWTINRRQTFIEDRDSLIRDMNTFIKDPKSRKRIFRKMNRTSNYLKGKDNYIRNWGFEVYMHDIREVVKKAKKQSNSVFLGGWSDGVEYLMIYANYRFKSGFGSGDLKGLVFFDENPEWGKLSGKEEILQKKIDRQNNLIGKNHLYMKYYPSLAVHTLALELAWRMPDKKSFLADYLTLPDTFKDSGMTNRALVGWMYDRKVKGFGKKVRGPFAYLIKAGDMDFPEDMGSEPQKKAPVKWNSYKKTGDETDIDLFIKEYKSAGRLWEYFYPRKILLEYFELGKCDFNCPEMKVFYNKENKLSVFYILTGTNNVGKSVPSGLKWYIERSGITIDRVVLKKLYEYAHADMFFAADAPQKIYQPLHRWMLNVSGIKQYNDKNNEDNK